MAYKVSREFVQNFFTFGNLWTVPKLAYTYKSVTFLSITCQNDVIPAKISIRNTPHLTQTNKRLETTA